MVKSYLILTKFLNDEVSTQMTQWLTENINCIANANVSQRKNCPYLALFWYAFSHIWTEYGEIPSISPYSVRMWENADQNNSEYGRFSRSV